MYKANKKHQQPALISSVQQLSPKYRKRLDESWAGAFYREFFCRIKEEAFACLYVKHPSRPNAPVNVLVGLEVLKAGHGWSDEELYDHFLFDVQVRYALGCHNFEEGDFDIRTVYNFRRRMSEYHLEHGVNLLAHCFEGITDQQLSVFQLHSDQQRMDSTQIASQILNSSRLQLAAELLQRLYRILNEEDQRRYQARMQDYLRDTTNQFVYRIKGQQETRAHLLQIGQILHRLLGELQPEYGQEPILAVAERFFSENFRLETEAVLPKDSQELSSGCLQSLDDLEASYRQKGNQFFKGYVGNLTETCHPDNPLQLITQVQVAPNNTEDSTMMIEALPNLVRRTDLQQIFTDGGYGSPRADQSLREHKVEQIQSAIRGTALNADKLHLSAYEIEQDENGQAIRITCPQGQTVAVQPTASRTSLLARFAPAICNQCPFHKQARCRILWRKKIAQFQMDFTPTEADAAVRRRRCLQNRQAPKNLRVAVEATVRSVKHPFPAGKLPVRGLFRMTCMFIASAAMTNIHRICTFQRSKTDLQAENSQSVALRTSFWSLFSGFRAPFSRLSFATASL